MTEVLTGSGDDCRGGGGLELERRNVDRGHAAPSEAAWREGEILKSGSEVLDLGRGTGLKVVVDVVSEEEVRLSLYCWSWRRWANKTPVTKIDI